MFFRVIDTVLVSANTNTVEPDAITNIDAAASSSEVKEKKVPKLLDGKFYQIKSREGNKVVVVCTACNENIKGNLSSTGNFKSHYTRKHVSKIKELEDYLSLNISKKTEKQMKIPEFQHVTADLVIIILSCRLNLDNSY